MKNLSSVLPSAQNLLPVESLSEFASRIEREFLTGSAIAPCVYTDNIRIVSDIEISDGGDVSTPIHDALNWKYTRFGHQAKPTLHAAIFINEDGSPWQAKLSAPRTDTTKGKIQKYETPTGNGSRAYLPTVNQKTRRLIANRYGVEVPPPGESFWNWLELHPEIPIIITEGGKKSLSLLSKGFVAIALYGINGGYRSKDLLGNQVLPYLIPDIARFAVKGRKFTLAFDQDTNTETRLRVNAATFRFSRLLTAAGSIVDIAIWDGQKGLCKGVDDLIVTKGVAAWSTALNQALSVAHWQLWQRLENRLTYEPSLQLTTADLSTLDIKNLPQQGIIALDSGKGTGKTKFIAKTTANSEKALLAGHRIALIQNLCPRLDIDYRGDLDKFNGNFIKGGAYTLRIGFCVDSLLAIDPKKFAGCDFIIDEVVQVVRHLLTSSTCAQDGKRPALLARFAELIRVARRVIIADADLNNQTLHYLKEFRADPTPIFLIRNDYQPQPYHVKFIQATSKSAIVNQLITDAQNIPTGKTLYVTTDSKATSKTTARLLQKQIPGIRILLINSETSGNTEEKRFMKNPDTVIAEGLYDVIICSPTVATGVSIEIPGFIEKVYGIFTGTSSTDADMSQSLVRVRDTVDRIVWCAKRGTNYSQVSRSSNYLEIKTQLQQRTDATVSLVRSNLRPDIVEGIANFDWQQNPHVNLYARISAEQNYSMMNLCDALMVRLKHEGHHMTIEEQQSDSTVKLLLKQAKDEIKKMEASAIVAAPDLTYPEIVLLESLEAVSPEDALAITKFYLKDFYCLDELTEEDVLWDKGGRRRGELLNLEAQLNPELAVDRTTKSLEKQATWNQAVCPWDISGTALRRQMREAFGLNDFLDPHKEWTHADIKPYADKIRLYAPEILHHLNRTVSDKMSDVNVVHQMLSQLGIKAAFRWSRFEPGFEGKKIKVYRLHADLWHSLMSILLRRAERRERLHDPGDDSGSAMGFNTQNNLGDPNPHHPKSLRETLIGLVCTVTGDDHQFLVQSLTLDSRARCQNLTSKTVVLLPFTELTPVKQT
ncbi:plasmid replication protein, CyRepA1 family [Nostoc sp. CCY0012]|uniref:plasmid replication protein, CyRepA1 family n=1 Tax=Nostoc sp. CCY0012 TaxID=1056123 RepID=UPI0039C629B8